MSKPHPILFELAAGRRPSVTDPTDAEDLLRSAFEHRMNGLLWSEVAEGNIRLPPEQMWALAAKDLAVRAHHERLWTVLADVQQRLARLGVQTATAKGVAAEDRWYLRMGERPCRDIDLLIEPGGESRIGDIVDELQPDHPLRAEIAELIGSGVLQSVDLAVAGVAIDLHTDLMKVEIPIRARESLWSRTRLLRSKGGITVRVVDAEISLIHFAVHLNKDRFARLLGYSDVARLLAHQTLDWGFIEGFVTREGLRAPVFNSLHAVTSALDVTPAPVPLQTRGWRARAWHRLWPVDRRLGGYLNVGTELHRQLWIPWLAAGRMRESFFWLVRRRGLPPGALLRVYDPDVRGPYLVRLLVGRYRGWRKARRAARAARRAGSAGRRPRG